MDIANRELTLEENCVLTYRVIRTIYQDGETYTIHYGVKGVDEFGYQRVLLREVSQSYNRTQKLVDKLNRELFTKAHLLDLIDRY